MFDQSIKRIGFACKYFHPDLLLTEKSRNEIQRPYNGKGTTRAWLNRCESKNVADAKIHEIFNFNIESTRRLIELVSQAPKELRMLRLGSDMLPFFTETTWRHFYDDSIKEDIRQKLAPIGELARNNDVRLSMHPGQFCVLASDRTEVVEFSLREIEYHSFIAKCMGYGKTFQDFKINIHVAGKRGIPGMLESIEQLSDESRNTLTIENEEVTWGLEDTLKLEKVCPLVLDIHHHYVKTKGEYILPSDDRFKRIIDSWRGVRPVIHYSVSKEEYLDYFPKDVLPDYQTLLNKGYSMHKLRAHSNDYPNTACNDWAISFLPFADIMCEAKYKNRAARTLHAAAY